MLLENKLGTALKYLLTLLLVTGALTLFFQRFVMELHLVDDDSMQPTIRIGERIVANKFIYYMTPPQRGDILMFRHPGDPQVTFIRRVIAIAGDSVEIKNGWVFVNGQVIPEPYTLRKNNRNNKPQDTYRLATVPENRIFVLGDNRNRSGDSRSAEISFIPLDLVEGQAIRFHIH